MQPFMYQRVEVTVGRLAGVDLNQPDAFPRLAHCSFVAELPFNNPDWVLLTSSSLDRPHWSMLPLDEHFDNSVVVMLAVLLSVSSCS